MDYSMVAVAGNISQEDFLAIVGGNASLGGVLHGGSATNTLNDTLGGVLATGGDNRTIFTGYPSGYTLPHIIFASIVVTMLMIVIVVGNMLVIIAIATEKALKNIQNWFIASLAVADFFLGLVIMPFSLANELMGYWIFGNWWCDIHSAMDVLLCTSSIMNLCLISLDRYWSITKAIEYLKTRTPARAAFMIAAVWIMSALVCIPPLLGWKAPRPEEHVELPQCQRPDGSFSATIDGNEHDMRFVYCAAAACAMPNDWRCVDQRKMAREGSVDRWRSTTFRIADCDECLVVPSSAGVAIRFFRLIRATFAVGRVVPSDTIVPRRLESKRATNIRKLCILTKDDDVRQFAVKRPLPEMDGKKTKLKAPKIQHLIAPVGRFRRRTIKAAKKVAKKEAKKVTEAAKKRDEVNTAKKSEEDDKKTDTSEVLSRPLSVINIL
ncbi:ribosomal protein S6 [Culex quinquefasciatus]|uniref:Ribosomal protein S6 n=1 Tax=Culex quinquefasciatus TaxID=7176 RepID=B0XHG5_CULQU|nr:ribosomal protein S6 [Culex quinquefasciatus]|eukprot:XP_001869087.1 ribosomal protein S6 [Culex quinquefasciatus]